MEDHWEIEQYRKWILVRVLPDITITENERGNIELESTSAMGYVNFYPQDIIELRIDRIKEEKTEFFLHFQATDMQRAKELYLEMEEVLCKLRMAQETRILLCCTSGLTTSYYAQELNKAAHALCKNCHFDAVSYSNIYQKGYAYDAILLAPQIAYQRKKICAYFSKAIVINIPPKMFAKYDTGSLIRLVDDELDTARYANTTKAERTMRFFETHYKILAVTVLNGLKEKHYEYRYYMDGNVVDSGADVSDEISAEQLDAIIEKQLQKHPEIESIGIGIPGTEENGLLFLPGEKVHNHNLVNEFSRKYHKHIFIFNDANMVVTGIYWLEDRYRSLIFYFLPNAFDIGGSGVVVNGHIIHGRKNAAGEIGYLQKVLQDSKDTYELVGKTLTAMICTVGPDAVFVYAPETNDIEHIRREIQKYMPQEFIPDLIYLESISEYMMVGTFLRCVWKLQDHERAESGMMHPVYL